MIQPPVEFDARTVRRAELARARALGVRFTELDEADSEQLLERFIDDFADSEERVRLRARIRATSNPFPPLHLDLVVQPTALGSSTDKSLMGWLTRLWRDARIVRLERRWGMPALDLVASTLDDTWAGSWPGVFVNFTASRAVVVTDDYAAIRCDLKGGPSPYR